MIKWIKNDFISVRANLCYMINKDIPLWVAVLYYIIALVILTPIGLFIALYYKIRLNIEVRQMKKRYEEYLKEEA